MGAPSGPGWSLGHFVESSRLRMEELLRRIGASQPDAERSRVLRDIRLTMDVGDASAIGGAPRTRRYFASSEVAAVAGQNALVTINVGAPLNPLPADNPIAGLLVRWWAPDIVALVQWDITMPDSANLIGTSINQPAQSRIMPIGTDPVDRYGGGGAIRDAASGTYAGNAAGQGFTYNVGTTLSAVAANAIGYPIINAGSTNRDNQYAFFVPQGRALQFRSVGANQVRRFRCYMDWVYERADLPT